MVLARRPLRRRAVVVGSACCLCAAAAAAWHVAAACMPRAPGALKRLAAEAAERVDRSGARTGRRSGLLAAGLAAALRPPDAATAITREERRVASLFLEASPSVLGIAELPTGGRAPRIAGSGFVWDKSHVVTNFHVIGDIDNPHISFLQHDPMSGEEHHTVLGATVVGADPISDIAVLQVGAAAEVADGAEGAAAVGELMRPLHRGASTSLRPGQEVFALGNPFGLEHSMSRGIISGVPRTLEGAGGRPISGIIQTDAAINPGNSGGPLLDSAGAVIGVNTAILSTSGAFAGVGLAIPIDTVEQNVASMLSKGCVIRPALGVVFAPDRMSEELGVGGAMVMRVVPGGPAQKAGMLAMRNGLFGDVIVGFDGKSVSSSDDVFAMLDKRSPGEDVVMHVQRPPADAESDGYEYVDLVVRLGASNPKVVTA